MTKNQLTQLFNGCVTLQKGNAVTLYFETDEQALAAFDYLSKLGEIHEYDAETHSGSYPFL